MDKSHANDTLMNDIQNEEQNMVLNNNRNKEVCIIGAGLTGLTCAYRLANDGFKVTVLECNRHPGGMVSSFQMAWEKIEHIYHHIFTSDNYVTELSSELGIEDQIKWLEPRDALYMNGHLYPFTSPLDLIKFKPIPFIERIRTGLSVLKAKAVSDYLSLENQTAKDWLIKESGQKSFDALWNPLLRSKFDDDTDNVSAVWIWNKFKLRGNSRGKSVSKESLGYMNGGFGTLIDSLIKGIESKGGEVLYGYTALNITKFNDDNTCKKRFSISCILEDSSSVAIKSDSVIATLSGIRFVNMTRELDLPTPYITKALNLKYKGDLCMVLRLKKSLSQYYWTTVCDSLPFVVVVEHTNLTGPRKYGGNVVYLSRYLDISDPLWTQSDSEIYKLFCNGLKTMYPDFCPSDVMDWRLTRTRYAQPVISKNYSLHMPEMKTPHDGLFLSGMAQIYPEDRGMNYAIRLANETYDATKEYLNNL